MSRSEQRSRSQATGRAQARPWWLGGVVIAIGALWLFGAGQLAQTATYAVIGPGFFVSVVGAGLILAGAILLVQIARGERFAAQDAEDTRADQPASASALALSVGAGAAPLLAMQHLGFPLTAALVFALTAAAFGSRRHGFNLAVGAALGGVCWYGFSLLGVALGDLFPLAGG